MRWNLETYVNHYCATFLEFERYSQSHVQFEPMRTFQCTFKLSLRVFGYSKAKNKYKIFVSQKNRYVLCDCHSFFVRFSDSPSLVPQHLPWTPRIIYVSCSTTNDFYSQHLYSFSLHAAFFLFRCCQ